MAFVGVNPENCQASITAVKSAYSDLIDTMTQTVKNDYVAKIAEAWGSPDAQKIMTAFKGEIDNLVTSTTSTFESIVNTMNGAAKSLLTQQGYTDWADVSFLGRVDKLSVDAVQADIGGSIEADNSAVIEANGVLNGTIGGKVGDCLKAAKDAISNSGFIGGGMQESLASSLSTIYGKVRSAFSNVALEMTGAAAKSTSALEEGATKIASDNFTVSE